jgi:tetratricopeptide (TPR) repeat protein
VAKARKFIEESGNNTSVHRILANALFEQKQYAEALKSFAYVSRKNSVKEQLVFFRKAGQAINKTCENSRQRQAAWEDFSGEKEKAFDQSLSQALQGDLDDSIISFGAALNTLDLDEATRSRWAEAYANIISAISGKTFSDEQLPELRDCKKVIVSGMGWSGSGAIYDYLSEFHQVVPIKGESPYIEAERTLKSIYGNLSDRKKLNKSLLEFFFYAVLGYAKFRSKDDCKLFQHARRKAESNIEAFSELLSNFSLFAAHLISQDDDRIEAFKKLSTFVVNELSIKVQVNKNQIALLDNAVHIYNIQCLDFLDDTTIICTFRDPRSNWVARVREAPFADSASQFIKKTDAIKKYISQVDAYSKKYPFPEGKSVLRLAFEDFVLKENLRDDLAVKLGLDLSKRNQYEYFKPWESKRNVFLHQEHENQDEIRTIEDAMGEYCYDLPPIEDVSINEPVTNSGDDQNPSVWQRLFAKFRKNK